MAREPQLTLRAELRPEEPGFFGRALRHPKLRCDFERDDDLRMIFEALEALDRRVFFSDPRGKNPGAGALLTDLDPTKPA